MWHKDLLGLGADDHPHYALLAGRALGQLLIGGLASGEHVTLQSTAHATRGYVRSQDDLQLLSNTLRGSDGVARLGLAAASPHVTLTGDVQITAHASIGPSTAPAITKLLAVAASVADSPLYGAHVMVKGTRTVGAQTTFGIGGGAQGEGTPTYSVVYGLFFFAAHNTPSLCPALGGLSLQQQSAVSGTGTLSHARGVFVSSAYWAAAKPANSYGIDVADQGHASVVTAYGLKCSDQTAVTVRLLELGPATPYLRLAGGAVPAVNTSHLWLNLGGTLKNVTEYNVNTAGAGFRALRVPN